MVRLELTGQMRQASDEPMRLARQRLDAEMRLSGSGVWIFSHAADTPFAKSLGARSSTIACDTRRPLKGGATNHRRCMLPSNLIAGVSTSWQPGSSIFADNGRLIDQVQSMPAQTATAASNSCEARVGSKTWPSHSRIVGSSARPGRIEFNFCPAAQLRTEMVLVF